MMMAKTQQNKANGFRAYGFTLIEVVVVLAIIGILAAIAIPSFAGYIDEYKYKDVLHQAEYGEDALMNLAARQYGSLIPITPTNFGDSFDDTGKHVGEENYIQVDDQVNSTFLSGTDLVQFTAANSRPKLSDLPDTSDGYTMFERLTNSKFLKGKALANPIDSTSGYGYAYIKILCENPGSFKKAGSTWKLDMDHPYFYPDAVTAMQCWLVKDNIFYYIEHNWVEGSTVVNGWRISTNGAPADTIQQYAFPTAGWTEVYTVMSE